MNPTAQHLLDLALSPSGLSALVLVLGGIAALVLGPSEVRRRRVAKALHHGFLIAEEIAAETEGEDVVDKVAAALKAADAYCVANGWRALKPGEVAVGKLEFSALNGAQKAAEKIQANALEAALPKA